MTRSKLFSAIKEANQYLDSAKEARLAGNEELATSKEDIAFLIIDDTIEPAWRAQHNTFSYQIKYSNRTGHYYAIIKD